MSSNSDRDSVQSSKKIRDKTAPTSSDFTTKAIYSSIKKKNVRSPSFNNSSDFEDDEIEEINDFPSGSIQLIRFVDNKIEVCEEGKEFLKKIRTEVGIVSVAGPARTGKSLLLNLLTKKNAFKVGNRVQACTQGVWFTPINSNNKLLLIIDSEGCKSVEKGANYDAKIFALLILISSIFVFNSRGVIDEQSISQLTLATYLSEVISFSMNTEESDPTQASEFAPKFVWVLRDFHLSLTDQEQNAITSDEYMEGVLSMKKFYGRKAEQNLKTREKFLTIFTNRSCFTLPRPADNENDLENLENIEIGQLKGKFVKAFNKLEKALINKCPLKKFKNTEVTGFQLVVLVEEIVKSINLGVVPNFHTAWEEVVRKQYEEFLEEAKINYAKVRGVSVEKMPYEESELILRLQTAKEESLKGLKLMNERRVEYEEMVIEEFEGHFREDLKFSLETNAGASEAYNLALIERVFSPILKNLGQYKDNFQVFETEWMSCMKEYERQAKGPGKIIAISQFYRKHQHTAYAKFFNGATEEYEAEIKRLRDLQKDYHNLFYEQFPSDKDKMIQTHVFCN